MKHALANFTGCHPCKLHTKLSHSGLGIPEYLDFTRIAHDFYDVLFYQLAKLDIKKHVLKHYVFIFKT